MNPVPDGDRTPIVTPAPIMAALGHHGCPRPSDHLRESTSACLARLSWMALRRRRDLTAPAADGRRAGATETAIQRKPAEPIPFAEFWTPSTGRAGFYRPAAPPGGRAATSDLPRGRAAVRCGRRPLPRRRWDRRPSRSLHGRRCRSRPRHARPAVLAARPACSAPCGTSPWSAAQRRHPETSSRAHELPAGAGRRRAGQRALDRLPFRLAAGPRSACRWASPAPGGRPGRPCSPTRCSTTCRSAWPSGTGAPGAGPGDPPGRPAGRAPGPPRRWASQLLARLIPEPARAPRPAGTPAAGCCDALRGGRSGGGWRCSTTPPPGGDSGPPGGRVVADLPGRRGRPLARGLGSPGHHVRGGRRRPQRWSGATVKPGAGRLAPRSRHRRPGGGGPRLAKREGGAQRGGPWRPAAGSPRRPPSPTRPAWAPSGSWVAGAASEPPRSRRRAGSSRKRRRRSRRSARRGRRRTRVQVGGDLLDQRRDVRRTGRRRCPPARRSRLPRGSPGLLAHLLGHGDPITNEGDGARGPGRRSGGRARSAALDQRRLDEGPPGPVGDERPPGHPERDGVQGGRAGPGGTSPPAPQAVLPGAGPSAR